MTTADHAELVAPRKRVRELETELAIHRRATELLKGDVGPNGHSQRCARCSPQHPRSP